MPAGSDSMSQPSRLSFVRVGIWLRMVKVPSFLASAWQYAKLRSSRDAILPNPSESRVRISNFRHKIEDLLVLIQLRMRGTFRKSLHMAAPIHVELLQVDQLTESFGEQGSEISGHRIKILS